MNVQYLYYILLIILVVVLVIYCIHLKSKQKDCYNEKDCERSEYCGKSLKNYKKGLPSEYTHNGNTSVLSIQTIDPTNFKNNTIIISKDPLYFPNGLSIYIDDKLVEIKTEDIDKLLSKPDDKENEHGVYDLKNLLTNMKRFGSNTKYSSIVAKGETAEPSEKMFLHSIQHYIGLIEEYIANNNSNEWRNSVEYNKWAECLDVLGIFVQDVYEDVDNLIENPPNIEDIYNWIKYKMTSIGGILGIAKKFQKRIKYDMIQSIVNNDPNYRTVDKQTSDVIGSGVCSIYPLKWWQNCQDGRVPVGSRGWTSNGACNKWYDHASGELMCASATTNAEYKVGGPCLTLIKNIEDDDVQKTLSVLLTGILTGLSLVPSCKAAVKVISTLIKLSFNNDQVKQVFNLILSDLKDVCYNYTCKDSKCKYCYPASPDSIVANRDCSSLSADYCNKDYAGCCKTEKQSNDFVCNQENKLLNNPQSSLIRLSSFV